MQHSLDEIRWLVVTGQGRSGTTALTKAVAEHPQVCSNRVESNVMKDVLLAGHSSSSVESRVRQMVLPREEHDRVFRQMLTRLLFPQHLWSRDEPPKRLSTFSAMSADAADFAVAALPGIHIANIVRNGIEVVASRMAHRVLGSHSFEHNCMAWAAAMDMAKWGNERDDFTLIRHDQLLNPHTCRKSMSVLQVRAGLDPSDSMAEYLLSQQRNQTTYDSESPEQAGDLSRRIERWTQWSDAQRSMFEDICAPVMEYFGYSIPWELA
jgi:Sulfotransferase family